jgi:glycosyltransferase involved in cell wall biosynthesis
MKNSISVVIPFYNSIEYIEDAIRIPIFDERVSEILIVDDFSDISQYRLLEEKVSSLKNGYKLSFDPNSSLLVRRNMNCLEGIKLNTTVDVSDLAQKIRVIRNDKNLGAFMNKFEAVKNAQNDWLYLLDSDNFLVDSSIPVIYALDQWNASTCYCPSVLIMERNKDLWRAWDDWNHRKFGYEPISLARVKQFIESDVELHKRNGCGLGLDGFLNTGNFFVNKNSYLSVFSRVSHEIINPLAADAIAFTYLWLKSGNLLQVVPGLHYYHRLLENSYWQTHGVDSGTIAKKFLDLIKDA